MRLDTERDYFRDRLAEVGDNAIRDAAERMGTSADALHLMMFQPDETEELEQAQYQVSDDSLMLLSYVVASYFIGPDDGTVDRDDIEVRLRHVMHAALREHRVRCAPAESQP